MNKYYVGQLSLAVTRFNNDDKPSKVDLVFNNGDFSEEMPFKLDHEYYVVKKDELDAYMARKEQLEQMNCTQAFGENLRLKAKVNELEGKNANLINLHKALVKENSELAEENESLVERNTKLRSRNRDLELENVKLKGELAQAEYELASFNGEHTVEFLYEKHEDNKHVVGWTDVSGKEYELTFVTPESKIHA